MAHSDDGASDDRIANMAAFTRNALELLEGVLKATLAE